MALTFNKVNAFVEYLAEGNGASGAINLGGANLKLAFTNTAHTSTWDKLADLTLATGCPANMDSVALSVSSSAQTAGTYKLVITDKVVTATGTAGPFQYVYIYDDGSTNDRLIGYYDYGSAITLLNGESLTINFDDSNGVLTIT